MDTNPITAMAENMKYRNLERQMDKLSSDINDIKASMESVKSDMTILTGEMARLSEVYAQLNAQLSATESILKDLGTKHDIEG